MSSPTKETSFAVLKHISLLVGKEKGIFDDAFKQFYCHLNDPTSVQYIKLEILPQLANESNVTEIVAELSEYVTDVNVDLAKRALKAIGDVALRLPSSADGILNQLMEYLEIELDYIRSDGLVLIKNLLCKYPARAGDVMQLLPACLSKTSEPL